MSWWLKDAAAVGSGVPDSMAQVGAATPVPQIGVENKPAPGQTGPRGMHGRTTYSRVNTGIPPTPDAGAASMKSQAPRGLESLKTAQVETPMTTTYMRQPSLQDLIKVAMEGSAAKIDLSLEAAIQMANDGHQPPQGTTKTAAAEDPISVPTDLCTKLAGAMYYIAQEMNPKLANIDLAATAVSGIGPGQGPGALTVAPTQAEGDGVLEAGQSGKATAANQVPVNSALQKDPTRPGPANSLATNDRMMHGEQPLEPISNEKTTLTNENVKASAAYVNNLIACGLAKVAMAEDGSTTVVPTEKLALMGAVLPAAAGAYEAPSGYKMRGAAMGSAGANLGGLAGGLGGGAMGAGLGGAIGTGIGMLGGGLMGAPVLGGVAGGLGGAGIGAGLGAVGGGLYGRQKGYEAAMRPYKEIQQLRQQQQQPSPEEMQVTAAAALPTPGAPAPQASGLRKTVGTLGGAALGAGLGTMAMPVLGTAAGALAGGALGRHIANKTASANDIYLRNLQAVGLLKAAEDAINPARVVAGHTQWGVTLPQGVSPSETGVPSEPSDVQSQKRRMIDSNDAAINYTRRDAKADVKGDLRDILHEPALSAGSDSVLQQAFSHNDAAGSKISSAMRWAIQKTAGPQDMNEVAQLAQMFPGTTTRVAPGIVDPRQLPELADSLKTEIMHRPPRVIPQLGPGDLLSSITPKTQMAAPVAEALSEAAPALAHAAPEAAHAAAPAAAHAAAPAAAAAAKKGLSRGGKAGLIGGGLALGGLGAAGLYNALRGSGESASPEMTVQGSAVKLAAARAIVSKMAEAACASDKKVKKAQGMGMGMTPPPPTPAMSGTQAAKTV